jgi:putative oxidoreductase
VLIPELAQLSDVALLLLRLMIAAVFATSGWAHATKPEQRGKSIEMTPPATLLLGVIELLGAASIALGIYPEAGAFLLIGVMVGAIYKKRFAWKTGFWGEDGQGWYYELLYLVCNLVILTTGGGALTIT